MGGVRVGSDVIIAAGAIVTKDLPSGGIYGGIPAKRIGNTTDFWKKRETEPYPSVKNNQDPTSEEVEAAWKFFYEQRDVF